MKPVYRNAILLLFLAALVLVAVAVLSLSDTDSIDLIAPSAIEPTPRSDPPTRPLPAGTIAGVVVNRRTEAPLKGARVRAGKAEVVTGPDGRFLLEGLGYGDVLLWVTCNHYRPSAAFRVDLPQEKGVNLGSLGLSPIPALRGRVVDVFGRAVPHARIRVSPLEEYVLGPDLDFHDTSKLLAGPPRTLASTRAAKDGRFELFPSDLSQKEFTLCAEAPGLGRTFRHFRARPEEELEFLLPPAEGLAGRVLFPNGRPVQGAEVLAVSETNVEWGTARRVPLEKAVVRTGSEGRFTFANLRGGCYTVLASVRDYPRHAVYHVESGERRLDIRLDPGFVLSGTVRSAIHQGPVAGAKITVDGPSSFAGCVTGPDGCYHAGRVMGEDLRIVVQAPGHSLYCGLLEEGVRGVVSHDVLLTRGKTVQGKVLALPDLVPVPRATVRLVDVGMYPMIVYETRTDMKGRFALVGVQLPASSGKLTLIAARAGFLSRDIECSLEEDERVFTLELKRSASLSGRVVDQQGLPVAGAEIVPEYDDRFLVTSYADYRLPGTRCDDGGWFHLPDVPPDRNIVLFAVAPGYAPGPSRQFRLAGDGHRDDLQMVLHKGGRIKGMVRGQAPLAGAVLTFERVFNAAEDGAFSLDLTQVHNPRVVDLFRRRAVTDSRGRFLLRNILPGEWQVTCRCRGWCRWTLSLTLDEGKTEALNVNMVEAEGVSGIVLDAFGVALSGAIVEVTIRGKTAWRGLSGNNGRFALPDAAQGPFGFCCQKDGYETAEIRDVYAGEKDIRIVMHEK
jgi:protocatechuate 3,4-dioxygenase beta subunit